MKDKGFRAKHSEALLFWFAAVCHPPPELSVFFWQKDRGRGAVRLSDDPDFCSVGEAVSGQEAKTLTQGKFIFPDDPLRRAPDSINGRNMTDADWGGVAGAGAGG